MEKFPILMRGIHSREKGARLCAPTSPQSPGSESESDGNPVAVVNTDGNYKYVGRLVVDFDENGVIIPDSIDLGIP